MNTGTFSWALYQLKQGKKIKRKHWRENIYYVLDNGLLYEFFGVKNEELDEYNETLYFYEILADDWEVVE
ncbi:hypothetical protein SAMN05192533_102289 [Mesobacillus persicus]|uniref:Thoeris anti-defense 2-like domain-containing protein n=1 Tax=Mesobacillus persicus TaxID=930146 RepID=A0A1H7XMX6_9BACI|nr:hypothetical protein [Mesobacillus persicus]SEM35282.1 hypothetical protein SAMN05192533_102289 [Mesobacillus persicus]